MEREIKRKLIHSFSAFYALFYRLLPYEDFVSLLFLSMVVAFLLEAARVYQKDGSLVVFDELLRREERQRLAGYFYLVLGLILLIAFDSSGKTIIPGILVAAIADTCSAIVGIKYGRHQFRVIKKRRSLEGTISGFSAAVIVTYPFLGPAVSLMAGIIYVLNDLFRPGDDNITNPLVPFVAWKFLIFLPKIL